MQYQIIIIGGGPAGLAAAVAAKEHGIEKVLLLEREDRLGGILNQCIHNGFGLHHFKEELTGPEYAKRYTDLAILHKVEYKLSSIVLSVEGESGKGTTSEKKGHSVTYMNETEGVVTLSCDAVILAMGCRERPRGSLNIPGSRPAGIYTAGMAQRLVNIEHKQVGKDVVVLGSGDIGLIMARRMTLEGAKVHAVAEIAPKSGGLQRNIEQCLNDYHIPLLLSHTVSRIYGKERITGVDIAAVDENMNILPETAEYVPCDTLLLSCGLIPENELSVAAGITIDPKTNGPVVDEGLQTSIKGIFSCGNALHVHGLADDASAEAVGAGNFAAEYVLG